MSRNSFYITKLSENIAETKNEDKSKTNQYSWVWLLVTALQSKHSRAFERKSLVGSLLQYVIRLCNKVVLCREYVAMPLLNLHSRWNWIEEPTVLWTYLSLWALNYRVTWSSSHLFQPKLGAEKYIIFPAKSCDIHEHSPSFHGSEMYSNAANIRSSLVSCLWLDLMMISDWASFTVNIWWRWSVETVHNKECGVTSCMQHVCQLSLQCFQEQKKEKKKEKKIEWNKLNVKYIYNTILCKINILI